MSWKMQRQRHCKALQYSCLVTITPKSCAITCISLHLPHTGPLAQKFNAQPQPLNTILTCPHLCLETFHCSAQTVCKMRGSVANGMRSRSIRSYTQHPTFLSFDRCLLAHLFSLGPQNLNHSLYTVGSSLLYPQFLCLPCRSEVSISCPQYTISSRIYHAVLRPMCAWNSYSSDPYL